VPQSPTDPKLVAPALHALLDILRRPPHIPEGFLYKYTMPCIKSIDIGLASRSPARLSKPVRGNAFVVNVEGGEDWCLKAGHAHTETAGWRWTWWVVTARALQQYCHHPECRGANAAGWGVPTHSVPLPDEVQVGVQQWLDEAKAAGLSAVRVSPEPSPEPVSLQFEGLFRDAAAAVRAGARRPERDPTVQLHRRHPLRVGSLRDRGPTPRF
jgi:hypothetical protein